MAKKYRNPKCKTCIYRAPVNAVNICDYILIMQHSRGCPVVDCDKYKKGNRVSCDKYWSNPDYPVMRNRRG